MEHCIPQMSSTLLHQRSPCCWNPLPCNLFSIFSLPCTQEFSDFGGWYRWLSAVPGAIQRDLLTSWLPGYKGHVTSELGSLQSPQKAPAEKHLCLEVSGLGSCAIWPFRGEVDDRIPDAGTQRLPWNDLAGGSVCRRRPSQPGQPGLRVGGLGSSLPDIATCPLSSDPGSQFMPLQVLFCVCSSL